MPTYTPLAQPSDLTDTPGLGAVVRDYSTSALSTLMVRASRAIESRCNRRLAPFTGKVESYRAKGVDPAGLVGSDIPLDLEGALGRSMARAYQFQNLVRDFWLKEYAPSVYTEWYTLSVETLQIVRSIGGSEFVAPANIEGPQTPTGHLRLPIGTYCPEGSTVNITYDGGFTVAVPDDLNLACVYQAAKFAILGAEPEMRKDMSTVELDAEILSLIAPYIR